VRLTILEAFLAEQIKIWKVFFSMQISLSHLLLLLLLSKKESQYHANEQRRKENRSSVENYSQRD
jgi:hypothetical protein